MRLPLATQLPADIGRMAEVARVLVKYGLAQWLQNADLPPIRRMLAAHSGEVPAAQPAGARLRMAMTELGTTFIKLGQVLSTREDLVGPEVAKELTQLQSHAPADPPDVVTATVEKELARPIAECFAEFDSKALASASIGQVHHARLTNGRAVIVKVQHPGIEAVVRRDLSIMPWLAEHAERQPEFRRYQPVELVRDFRSTLMRELDFRRELRNLQQFRRNFADDKTVVFPKPHADLSTGRVLTMQLLKGTSVADVEKLRAHHVDCDSLARRGAGVFVQMIFRDGFYHADPHPGNLLLPFKGQLGILDAGMVGRIDEHLRDQVVDIVLAAADGDATRLAGLAASICKASADLDRGALSSDLMEVVGQFGSQEIGQFDLAGALTSATHILHDYNLVLPSRLSMLIKCLIVLEGTAKALSPKFNLVELLQPYHQQFVLQRLSPKTWLRKATDARREWTQLAENAPVALQRLLEQLQTGNLAVRIKHPLLESSVNRLVCGLCISAFLVTSALLWIHAVPPTIGGVSLLGAAGYAVAVFLTIRILYGSRQNP